MTDNPDDMLYPPRDWDEELGPTCVRCGQPPRFLCLYPGDTLEPVCPRCFTDEERDAWRRLHGAGPGL